MITKLLTVRVCTLGTDDYTPPEWYSGFTYRAGPSTVWQLGAVLFEMLHGNSKFETKKFLKKELIINCGLSKGQKIVRIRQRVRMIRAHIVVDHQGNCLYLSSPLFLSRLQGFPTGVFGDGSQAAPHPDRARASPVAQMNVARRNHEP